MDKVLKTKSTDSVDRELVRRMDVGRVSNQLGDLVVCVRGLMMHEVGVLVIETS